MVKSKSMVSSIGSLRDDSQCGTWRASRLVVLTYSPFSPTPSCDSSYTRPTKEVSKTRKAFETPHALQAGDSLELLSSIAARLQRCFLLHRHILEFAPKSYCASTGGYRFAFCLSIVLYGTYISMPDGRGATAPCARTARGD